MRLSYMFYVGPNRQSKVTVTANSYVEAENKARQAMDARCPNEKGIVEWDLELESAGPPK